MERTQSPLLVYGGSFDPVHNGHVAAFWLAAHLLNAGEARLLPCFLSPLKSQVFTTPEQRCALLQLVVTGLNQRSSACLFSLDRREIEIDGPSFTCDTLAALRQEQGETRPIIWLLGDDAWRQLPQWRHWQRLTEFAHLLIAARPGVEAPIEPAQTAWAAARQCALAQLGLSPSGGIAHMNNALLAISASHIRTQIQQGVRPLGLLPDAVEERIYQQGLYLNS
ncbi:MAG TPA: nicotinate (nicotinamide) nucleotide adenylyltransferase [Marinagarivorans sp.]|nr:nicotinate (nicotinamide) nucleotide adenylyltransferase [Marinagarivorans sp.]HNG59992.1 nicotinate (nicotinamide) nucleotide adenylyltransferase [Cellvibrionaceae bacterium]